MTFNHISNKDRNIIYDTTNNVVKIEYDTINLVFSNNDFDVIKANDSYNVFCSNLDALIEDLSKYNFSGDFYIRIRSYNKTNPLDFNWMLVIFQNGEVYEVTFYHFKINQILKRPERNTSPWHQVTR